MPAPAEPSQVFRFDGLEADLRAGVLRKNGQEVKLQEQPLQILRMLLEHPGEVVTREEIHQKLWPTDTFVEFDHSINAAIQRLRQALGDSAERPRFVETMARRGYRFIAPVALIYDRRPEDAAHRAALQRRIALAAGAIVAAVAVLLALNVAGLRDRVAAVAGAGPSARPAGPTPKIESLAVLPLENLSRDPEQEYFADGMTDALITDLGKVSALRVISRQSTMRYKGSKKQLPEIARELKVDAVVEGTVQRSGDRVRITAQLLDARTDRHLWAETYERDLRDVLSLEDDVARAIAGEIQIKLTPQEHARLASARPVNPDVLELYLRGSDSLGRGNTKKALEYFQQAIQNDANFARAYVGIARAYGWVGEWEELASVEAYAKQKAYARKALELDDSLGEAHVELGFALFQGDWEWLGAERELRRGLEINPNSAHAHNMYGIFLSLLNRPEEAIAEQRRVLEINPLTARSYEGLGYAYYWGRRHDESLAEYRKAVQVSPQAVSPILFGWVYREKAMYKEAIAEFLQLPDNPPKLGHLGNTYARAGRTAEAHRAIQKLIELSRHGVGNYAVAVVYAGLGDKDRAFEWLEKAYKVHDKGMTYLKVDPPLDPLRSDPRFQDLLRRMNFPQ